MCDPDPVREKLRAAMLSVYYHALGRKLELRGAPAVIMPSSVEPIPLATALDTLRSDPVQFNRALWTIARITPPQEGAHDVHLMRYPREVLDALTCDDERRLKTFETLRRGYRSDAHLLGEALSSYARGEEDISSYIQAFEKRRDHDSLSAAVASLQALGGTDAGAVGVVQFLTTLRSKDQTEEAGRLVQLSEEVGLPLTTFMQEFSHGIAFEQAFTRDTPHDAGRAMTRGSLTVLPTSSITVQDARSLLTTITVSALVRTDDFATLCVGMDPQCWMTCSDAFKESHYIDSTTRRRQRHSPAEVGQPFCGKRLLEERVRIAWGIDNEELGYFHNLLNVRFRHSPQPTEEDPDLVADNATVEFNLNRCLSSRILWDVRPGGILIDQGYARARSLGNGSYRVTVRKTLRFSDRTPYSGGAGWNDLGQVLNFLAPAAMSWWLEGEMYNQGCDDIQNRAAAAAEARRAPAPACALSAAAAASGQAPSAAASPPAGRTHLCDAIRRCIKKTRRQ